MDAASLIALILGSGTGGAAFLKIIELSYKRGDKKIDTETLAKDALYNNLNATIIRQESKIAQLEQRLEKHSELIDDLQEQRIEMMHAHERELQAHEDQRLLDRRECDNKVEHLDRANKRLIDDLGEQHALNRETQQQMAALKEEYARLMLLLNQGKEGLK